VTGASEALIEAAVAALETIAGIGRVYDAPPLQAAAPHALVGVDFEGDWGHKGGSGREVRLATTLFDKAERPVRLRRLAAEAESTLGGLAGLLGEWRIVSMRFVRTRLVREPKGSWAAVVEFRARLLAEA
jgi:hypothetical protein